MNDVVPESGDACGYRHLDHANDFEPSTGHAWLRDRCPVHIEGGNEPPFYVVSRHDDSLAILKQPDLWGQPRRAGNLLPGRRGARLRRQS